MVLFFSMYMKRTCSFCCNVWISFCGLHLFLYAQPLNMAAFCLRVLLLWAGILVVTNCEYSLLFDTKSDAERGAVTMFLISLHFPFYKVIYSIIWGKCILYLKLVLQNIAYGKYWSSVTFFEDVWRWKCKINVLTFKKI